MEINYWDLAFVTNHYDVSEKTLRKWIADPSIRFPKPEQYEIYDDEELWDPHDLQVWDTVQMLELIKVKVRHLQNETEALLDHLMSL